MCHSFVLLISLSYVSVQILQNRDTSASLPDPKGQRIMVVVCITKTLQHFSLNVTLLNILVDIVSSDHRARVYGNNDSISDSTSHTIARDDFMRSRNLVNRFTSQI